MQRESTQIQMHHFEQKGAKTVVIDRGVHGSSMLVDQRTGHEMTNARRLVMSWLKKNQN
jgi:hypothetical protein